MPVAIVGLLPALEAVPEGVWWTSALVVVTAVLSIVVAAFFLVRLPPTYFVDDGQTPEAGRRGLLSWAGLVVKNLVGGVLVVTGVVMLFTPGQGLLTILIGVMLLNFPGKRRLEKKLVARPAVLEAINRLRARWGRPPLLTEKAPCCSETRP